MRFTYTYRSSDGQRHAAEIEAGSRDAAFARVRAEMGVKPIKMVAVGGSRANGEGAGKGATRGRSALVAAAVLSAAALGGVAWWAYRGSSGAGRDQPVTVMTPQGPVTYTAAQPLPRQAIPGDRGRIRNAMDGQDARGAFRSAAERWLARYAEPGRVPPIATNEMNGGETAGRPAGADFTGCLKEPIRIASNDFTEVVDLKRIVEGMKREMRAYLAGGGTAEGYLAELEKRQRLEISYRERAEQKLDELLSAANGQAARPAEDDGRGPLLGEAAPRRFSGETGVSSVASPNALKAAYAYWLKANAQLQAMGIYPLALPDSLRSYQMSLDIDE